MIVASLALVIAVGGTSYAASQVTSANIKNNTIKSADIKNNSVASTDIKNSSVAGKDIKNNSLTGDDVNESTLGTVPKASNADSATQVLNAGALSGFGPTSLVRTARDAIDGSAVGGTTAPTDAAVANVAAPTAGYLTIRAGSDVYNPSADSDEAVCWIELDGTEIGASERVIDLDGASGNVNHEENCSTNATVPVSPGVHNVTYVADPDDTSTAFDETSLSAIFIPFGNDGTQPTSFAINKGASKGASHANK
jgi:hypothetical protein